MKINLKVRLRNKVFWATMLSAVITFAYQVLRLFDIVPPVTEDVVENVIITILSFLAMLGVLNDPTVSGLSDSANAMGYEVPKENVNGE